MAFPLHLFAEAPGDLTPPVRVSLAQSIAKFRTVVSEEEIELEAHPASLKRASRGDKEIAVAVDYWMDLEERDITEDLQQDKKQYSRDWEAGSIV